jgi:hypothetical protein
MKMIPELFYEHLRNENLRNMTRHMILILLLHVNFLSCGQLKSSSFQADSVAVIRIAQQLLDAVGTGDTVTWKRYLHPDCIVQHEDGMLKRGYAILSEIRPLPAGYTGSITVTQPVLLQHEKSLILNFIADEHLTLYNQTIHTAYSETDTYINVNNSWMLIASVVFELSSDPPVQYIKQEVLERYVGLYVVAEGVEFNVTLDNGKLMGQRSGRSAMELLPETETVFFIQGQRGRKIFISDDMGNIVKMVERRNGRDLVWERR